MISRSIRISAEIRAAVCTIFITVLTLIFHFRLWKMNIDIPFEYQGDGILTMSGFRHMQLKGWYFRSGHLGFPFGQQLFDFPAISDGFNLVLAWLSLRFGLSVAVTFNLLYFGGYLFAALSGYIGARILFVPRVLSIAVGFLYTFLPYHFLHGPGHLFLSLYWMIPIWSSLIVRQIGSHPVLPEIPRFQEVGFLNFSKSRTLWMMIIVGVISCATGIYYAIFFLLTTFFGLCYHYVAYPRSKRKRVGLLTLFVSGIFSLGIQAIPVLFFMLRNGKNPLSVDRPISDIEFFSLRFVDLFLPINQHRIIYFSEFASQNISKLLSGEPTESLGIVASIGVICLIFQTLIRPFNNSGFNKQVVILGQLFLTLFLIATVGGGGQIFAALGFTEIRVWSRISIVFGFLALVAIADVLKHIYKNRNKVTRKILLRLLPSVTFLSFLDTNPRFDQDSYRNVTSQWNSDKKLVELIEDEISPTSAIFQFPIIHFPEFGTIESLGDYQLMRGYLHSASLCWSYGAMKGREGKWVDQLKDLPLPQILIEIRQKGFNAIWVEKAGYIDRGDKLISELTSLVGSPTITDPLDRVVVFHLPKSTGGKCRP